MKEYQVCSQQQNEIRNQKQTEIHKYMEINTFLNNQWVKEELKREIKNTLR